MQNWIQISDIYFWKIYLSFRFSDWYDFFFVIQKKIFVFIIVTFLKMLTLKCKFRQKYGYPSNKQVSVLMMEFWCSMMEFSYRVSALIRMKFHTSSSVHGMLPKCNWMVCYEFDSLFSYDIERVAKMRSK